MKSLLKKLKGLSKYTDGFMYAMAFVALAELIYVVALSMSDGKITHDEMQSIQKATERAVDTF